MVDRLVLKTMETVAKDADINCEVCVSNALRTTRSTKRILCFT